MRKKSIIFLFALILLILYSTTLFATKEKFVQNDLKVKVTKSSNSNNPAEYTVTYPSGKIEKISKLKNSKLNLLLLNGSFLMSSDIVVDGYNIMIPVRDFVEAIGGTVTWHDQKQELVIRYKKIVSNIRLNDINITKNDVNTWIDKFPTLIGNRTYMSIRSLEKIFSEYLYNNGTLYLGNSNEFLIICIDEKFDESQKIYSSSEGKEIIKNLFPVQQRDFIEKYLFEGLKIGRVQMYVLAGYEKKTIFFNTITGQVYSSNANSSFLEIQEGVFTINN